MTREQELWVMNEFKELYSLPPGVLEKKDPDWPDFLLTTSNGTKIGIELTEIVDSDDVQRDYVTRNKITDAVLEQLKPKMPFRFAIDIELLEMGVSKAQFSATVDALVSFCLSEFDHLANNEKLEFMRFDKDISQHNLYEQQLIRNWNFRNLPAGINTVSMMRVDFIDESFNPAGGGLSVPHFTKEHLNKVLAKKEPKLQTYLACDAYWLIIWEGKLPAGYFHDIELALPIKSLFDKVFIFRSVKREVVTVK